MEQNLISRNILGYEDLLKVSSGTDNEELVDARLYDPTIETSYEKFDMVPYTGTVILVRNEVAKKLAAVNKKLLKLDQRLRVVYGYRHPEVQERYFSKRRSELRDENPFLSDAELDAYTHNFVAVPNVGGHPTGGAVDLTVVRTDESAIDMGTGIADYTDPEKMKTFGIGSTIEQLENRLLLHDLMIEEGFAPFYGEWWHFSYGDREWAAFYGNESAVYGPVSKRMSN